MQTTTLIIVLLILMAGAYQLGRRRSSRVATAAGGVRNLHSLPSYYGFYTAIWCGLPALLVLMLWVAFQSNIVPQFVVVNLPQEIRELPPARLGLVINDIRNLAEGNITSGEVNPAMQAAADYYNSLRRTSYASLAVVTIALALLGIALGWRFIAPQLKARNRVEMVVKVLLVLSSTIAIFTTIGIALSVLFESIRFFEMVPLTEFMFGLEWSPQMAIRSDQVGSSGAFGAIPLFVGTLLISLIAMLVAVPIGLMSAIYLSEYTGRRLRAIAKPILEILAGIPTVVYGFFAALTVAPFIRNNGALLGLDVSSESALAAGLMLFMVTLILNVIALHVVRKYREQYE